MATAKRTTEIARGHWQNEDNAEVIKASDEQWAEYLRLPHCIALGEPSGKLIPGTRLTENMSLHECSDALKALSAEHPTAGIYLASVVSAQAA